MVHSAHIINTTQKLAANIYLTCHDLNLRQTWLPVALAYQYSIDSERFLSAVQTLVNESYPLATCRLGQDLEGRLYIDTNNAGLPVTIASEERLHISAVASGYARSSQPEFELVNKIAEAFTQELWPDRVQRGEAPLLAIQLTRVQGGSVLGVSFSHALADDAVIDTLPKHRPPPASFQEYKDRGVWDVLDGHTAERAAGVAFTHAVIHISGAGLDWIRQDLAASSAAKAAGVTSFSAHDIMCAALWVFREFGNGNDLSEGLKQCWIYLVDLRRYGSTKASIPRDFWGNAQQAHIAMPPPFVPAGSAAAAPASDRSTRHAAEKGTASPLASNGPTKSFAASGSACSDSSAQILSVFASAACAIHTAVQGLRDDPMTVSKGLAALLNFADEGMWKRIASAPGFSPFRDCAGVLSSFRNMDMERADFGQGRPQVIGARLMPLTHKGAIMTSGPGGDGILCFTGFDSITFERLHRENILQMILPEVQLISPST